VPKRALLVRTGESRKGKGSQLVDHIADWEGKGLFEQVISVLGKKDSPCRIEGGGRSFHVTGARGGKSLARGVERGGPRKVQKEEKRTGPQTSARGEERVLPVPLWQKKGGKDNSLGHKKKRKKNTKFGGSDGGKKEKEGTCCFMIHGGWKCLLLTQNGSEEKKPVCSYTEKGEKDGPSLRVEEKKLFLWAGG